MKDNNLIIELKDVSLVYKNNDKKDLVILDSISAKLKQGESLSIVGPSGSGKTSLLMLLAGVEQPTSGSIKVIGKEISRLSENELATFRQKQIGVVFQNFHLIPTMNALENVSVALELSGFGEESEKLAFEGLKAVGLEDRVHHYPEQLSGGEQQRVAIARAFAICPALLFADEPTGNLDEENSDVIIDLLFELKEKFGTTLVLITHDMDLANKTSKKFIIKDHKLYEEK